MLQPLPFPPFFPNQTLLRTARKQREDALTSLTAAEERIAALQGLVAQHKEHAAALATKLAASEQERARLETALEKLKAEMQTQQMIKGNEEGEDLKCRRGIGGSPMNAFHFSPPRIGFARFFQHRFILSSR